MVYNIGFVEFILKEKKKTYSQTQNHKEFMSVLVWSKHSSNLSLSVVNIVYHNHCPNYGDLRGKSDM